MLFPNTGLFQFHQPWLFGAFVLCTILAQFTNGPRIVENAHKTKLLLFSFLHKKQNLFLCQVFMSSTSRKLSMLPPSF